MNAPFVYRKASLIAVVGEGGEGGRVGNGGDGGGVNISGQSAIGDEVFGGYNYYKNGSVTQIAQGVNSTDPNVIMCNVIYDLRGTIPLLPVIDIIEHFKIFNIGRSFNISEVSPELE